MAQYNDTGYGTISLSADVSQFIRLTAAGGIAGVGVLDVGTARVDGKNGEEIGFAYINKQGTTKMVCAAAVASGVKVYTAANGKISSTQATGSFLRGISMQAGSGDGSIIEIMQLAGDSAGA